jgi:ankyrin repeat protein
MIACHHNHVALVEYLITVLHASINVQDSLGWSALMLSCREGHAEMVDLLLNDEFDTDIELTGDQGINALMCAADAGHTRIVRALIEKSADVNACTNVRRAGGEAVRR